MSLNCTGPDRKKIKLTSSHVSHLLIITDSPKILLDITREACSWKAGAEQCSMSFHFVFSVLRVFSSSCLFFLHAYTISILDYADFVAIRAEKGKLGKVASLARTFCFLWWCESRENNINTCRGGVRVFAIFKESWIILRCNYWYFKDFKIYFWPLYKGREGIFLLIHSNSDHCWK